MRLSTLIAKAEDVVVRNVPKARDLAWRAQFHARERLDMALRTAAVKVQPSSEDIVRAYPELNEDIPY